MIKDETAAAIALQNGEIDIFFALQPPAVIERLARRGDAGMEREANHTINLGPRHRPGSRSTMYGCARRCSAASTEALIDGFFKGTKGGVQRPDGSLPSSRSTCRNMRSTRRGRSMLKEAGAEGFSLDLVAPSLSPLRTRSSFDRRQRPERDRHQAQHPGTRAGRLPPGPRQGRDHVRDHRGGRAARSRQSDRLAYAKKSLPPGLNTSHYAGIEELLAALPPPRSMRAGPRSIGGS